MPTPSQSQLDKNYKPADHEDRIWARWNTADADGRLPFHADPARVLSGEARPYCVLIPPPNVTAALHLGHALNNTLQDVLVRAHRLKGFETLWMPGTDHAGIATQTVVDRRLKEAGKPALAEHKQMEAAGENGREKFVAQVQAWKDEYEHRITEQLKAMGCSCDFDRQRFTMDEVCARAVREAFFRLFKDGLIYRGKRLVNWDPVTQTALADDEVENKEIEGHFYFLRYPLAHPTSDPKDHDPVTWGELATRGYPGADEHPEDDQAWVTIATTRPETYLGDTAVAVNPKDPRAAAVRGLLCILPLVGRLVPIIEDDYVVMPVHYGGDENDAKAKMATGFLKVTPAHDPNDWDIGQRHEADIRERCSAKEVVINVMASDASISKDHGWSDYETYGHNAGAEVFVGLSREDARQKVIEEFQAHTINSQPLLEDIKPHVHSVGHSYRSHAAIEPYLSDQWYCRVTDDRLRGSAQRAINADQRSEASLAEWPESQPRVTPGGTGFQPVASLDSTDRPDHLTIYRRHLPHWQIGGSTYFVTFRSRKPLAPTERAIVLDACFHFHGDRHVTNLAVVMDDHVHLLITPQRRGDGWWPLEDLLHSIKSYSANQINTERGETGSCWQDESFDRIIRDEAEFVEKWNYMLENPVKAGLAQGVGDYPYIRRGEDERVEVGAELTGWKPVPPVERGDGGLTFYPSRYAKNYEQWHDNLRDWCISRQLWWGHRIPVWKVTVDVSSGVQRHAAQIDPSQGSHYRDLIPHLTNDAIESIITQFQDTAADSGIGEDAIAAFVADHNTIYLCPSLEAEPVFEWLLEVWRLNKDRDDLLSGGARLEVPANAPAYSWSKDGSERVNPSGLADSIADIRNIEQDPDVLDTWFSSALWPLSTLGWPNVASPAGMPRIYPKQIDPGDTSEVQSIFIKRVNTWREFIGTPDEFSGTLIDNLLRLRDQHKKTGGAALLTYQLFSAADLEADRQEAIPLLLPDDIQQAEDLICAVALKTDNLVEIKGLADMPDGPASPKWFLEEHGFLRQSDTEPGLLEAFNPTSVLTTAREIITLWVSRMVMFNRYFLGSPEDSEHPLLSHGGPSIRYASPEFYPDMVTDQIDEHGEPDAPQRHAGPVPFHDTFIHAMIQDGDGRKMSKSLGNGVDPLDIIHSHGADAMRFTLVEMTTQTQDVRMPVEEDEETGRNTSPKFDLGRNFCNKVWNAARFAMAKLPASMPEEIDPADLTLADRWMLTRLAQGVREIDEALASYQFSGYAKALYDVVRRDFCDWYLEAIKPTIADSPAQQGALRLILDAQLRLLHPVTPFITEAIHEALSEIRKPRLAGLELGAPRIGSCLATAAWPVIDASLEDADAVERFERVRGLVDAIRAVRSQHQVNDRRQIAVQLEAGLLADLGGDASLVAGLAGAHTVSADAIEGDTVAMSFGGVEHRLGDLTEALDADAERERLTKQLADLQKKIDVFDKRLNNPGYTEKAPPHMVQETRDQREQAATEAETIRGRLSELGGATA